jgi:hypothetical protein
LTVSAVDAVFGSTFIKGERRLYGLMAIHSREIRCIEAWQKKYKALSNYEASTEKADEE